MTTALFCSMVHKSINEITKDYIKNNNFLKNKNITIGLPHGDILIPKSGIPEKVYNTCDKKNTVIKHQKNRAAQIRACFVDWDKTFSELMYRKSSWIKEQLENELFLMPHKENLILENSCVFADYILINDKLIKPIHESFTPSYFKEVVLALSGDISNFFTIVWWPDDPANSKRGRKIP